MLLKLLSLFNVSSKCIDQLVEKFQFISTEASGQAFRNIIEETLKKRDCFVNLSVITDLIKELCESTPLSTTLGLGGPFWSAYKRKEYFNENFYIVETVEYIICASEKCSFQYIPILRSLSHLLNDKNIFQKAVESFDISKVHACTTLKSLGTLEVEGIFIPLSEALCNRSV